MPIEKVTVQQGGVQKVTVVEGGVKIVVKEPSVKVVTLGIQGPPGPSGPAGTDFEQAFNSPLAQWVVNHNLGKRPLVTLLTTGGVEMGGDVIHTTINQLVVNFSSAVAGRIRCV